MERQQVEAICYRIRLGIKDKILEGKYHVCLVLFGFLYECGSNGIKKSDTNNKDSSINPKSVYNDNNMAYRKYMGLTKKSIFEFELWCEMVRNIFGNENSNLWAFEACKFLHIADTVGWATMNTFADVSIEPLSVVEAVCWDITYGVAETSFGRKMIKWATSSKERVPNGVYHAGLIAFGYLYEYGTDGILKHAIDNIQGTADPTSYYNGNAMKYRLYMGKTTLTIEQFDIWVDRIGKGKYYPPLYSTSQQNCVHWAIDAFKFLKVTYPADWDNIRALAEANGIMVKLIAASGRTTGRSRGPTAQPIFK